MKRTGADFHIIGLQQHAALLGPVVLQRQDQSLKGFYRVRRGVRDVRQWFSQLSKGRIGRQYSRCAKPVAMRLSFLPQDGLKHAALKTRVFAVAVMSERRYYVRPGA